MYMCLCVCAIITCSCKKISCLNRSIRSSKPRNFQTKAIGKKSYLAELLNQESFLIKQQVPENESEKLQAQQQIAKSKAKIEIFGELTVNEKGMEIELYNIEATSIIEKSKYGAETYDVAQ